MVLGFRLLLFRHAPDVFNAEHEDMSYGWYVPLFSLYVLWTERARIREIVTVHLRLFASSAAFALLDGFGAEVIQRGTIIGAADGSFAIDVAEPCSGLRSLFALAALTAGYAYFAQPTWTRRAILFALSVPIAIIGNVVRLMTICIVANCASKEFAMGFYHDYSGYVVFAAAIALMLLASECLNIAFRRRAKEGSGEPAQASPAPAPAPAARSRPAVLGFATAFFVAAMLYQATTPEVVLAEAPDVHLAEIEGWTSEELGPGEAELKMLPADTRIEKRRYESEDGDWFVATLVVGGASKSSIHRPELCLPAQGWRMANPKTVEIDGVQWRTLSILSGTSPEIGFMYTFRNQAGFGTASHVSRIWRDVVDRSFLNRIDRWVMVTVNSSDPGGEALERIARLLKKKGVVK